MVQRNKTVYSLGYVHLLIGGGEGESKLHLQEETIYDLKQQLSTMMWRFEDLSQNMKNSKVNYH